MQITIIFPSLFKIYAGKERDELAIADGTTVEQLTQTLSMKYPNLPFDSHQTFFVVNDKIAQKDRVLSDGDTVKVYQALAGG